MRGRNRLVDMPKKSNISALNSLCLFPVFSHQIHLNFKFPPGKPCIHLINGAGRQSSAIRTRKFTPRNPRSTLHFCVTRPRSRIHVESWLSLKFSCLISHGQRNRHLPLAEIEPISNNSEENERTDSTRTCLFIFSRFRLESGKIRKATYRCIMYFLCGRYTWNIP